jgi:hypothetical protein
MRLVSYFWELWQKCKDSTQLARERRNLEHFRPTNTQQLCLMDMGLSSLCLAYCLPAPCLQPLLPSVYVYLLPNPAGLASARGAASDRHPAVQ